MSLIDSVHSELETVEAISERTLIMADGDNTLFKPWTAEPYADAPGVIEKLNPVATVLVSANPDVNLAFDRQEALSLDMVRIPPRAHWAKKNLFEQTFLDVERTFDFDAVLVLGDRWLMDVAVAAHVSRRRGHPTHAALIRRAGEPAPTRFDRFLLQPIEKVGFVAAVALHADGLIRSKTAA